MYNIIFFGTSDFAIPSLAALAQDERFHIQAIVTQPDRPVGRHAQITPPPIKLAAQRMAQCASTPIIQPEKIKEETFSAWIKGIGQTCDAFVVVSYGKILPQWLLDLPKHGVINVHGSLLPKWRGASPIQASIVANDRISGVTIMLLDALMDHGPILAQAEEPIYETDTGGSLHNRLAQKGAHILPDTLIGFIDGSIQPMNQDHEKATVCSTLSREHGNIDWKLDASTIERIIRAYQPWPGAWTMWNEKRFKLLLARIGESIEQKNPGERFIRNKYPCITCGNGTVLELLEVQPEGKSRMDASTFLRGNTWE